MTEKKEHLVSYTAAELNNLPDDTDWDKVLGMSAEQIELAAAADIAENLAGFQSAGVFVPQERFENLLPLEDDVLLWFKNKGFQPKQYINNIIHEQMRQNP